MRNVAAVILLLFANFESDNGQGYEVRNPYFHFPNGSPYMGILTAFAIPLKLQAPGDIFIAVNFEASYNLPQNQTYFTWPPIVGNATARQVLYSFFEKKLESHGYPGRACLLRAICEGTEYSTYGTGVLGDIIHIILTPSSSVNAELLEEYEEAELQARKKGKCKKFHKTCKFSILNLFTWVGTIFGRNGLIKTPILK
ncbi:uncharacterized protein LOC132708360 [Cylas formicarius]|uniref:uncharacterized protein LOC132708360 n=1 Tax=Cylas formicarius TaxID=197179 RepID=UPI0029585CF1|nr:uncharacterized protein LOC132708360 [Cylas formicarius]